MNVVLYLRYSSDKQTEQSIEGQQRVCTEYCQRNGMDIIGVYIDRATSASKDIEKRIDFQRMIKDSEKGMFSAVIVYKLDRFSRNRYDTATYKNRLSKNGVKVISATENISEDPEGVILESLLEGMAEYYSRELSQKVTRGMNETALKGNSCGGTIPLGYKVVNKKLVIDEATAPIVKEIFTRFANGESKLSIAEDLNRRGIKTSTGASFNKNSFQNMLKNVKYIGIYKYKDIKMENVIPAIIEKDLFDKVQERLSLKLRTPRKRSESVKYLLTGKLFCGHCDTAMNGEYGTSVTGKKYYYYACAEKKKKRCDKKSVPKDLIEQLVVEDAVNLLTEENIEKLADAAIEEAEKDAKENLELQSIKKQLRQTEISIANLLKLVERGSDSEQLFTRLEELENSKKFAQMRLADAEAEVIKLDRAQIIWFLSKFAEGDPSDPDYRRRIIDMLINSVTIWDEPDGFRIVIAYNLTSLKDKTFRMSKTDIGEFEKTLQWVTKKGIHH